MSPLNIDNVNVGRPVPLGPVEKYSKNIDREGGRGGLL